jgi:hypothetical protein
VVVKIGTVAYKLDLPIASNIDPIFHVSQLKRMVSNSTLVSASLPDPTVVSYQVLEEVLESRLVKKGDTEVAQVLIKWSNMSQELATWEDREYLH